jgi:hypothetical protein
MTERTPVDPRSDDEFPAYLRAEQLALAARTDAQRAEATQAWNAPPYPVTAYEQLAEEPPEIDWVVEDLWPSGIAQVNAQKKSGKTTLALGAAAALVTGEPFLERFDVKVESDCRVGYLNMELSRGHFNRWVADMALPDDALKRLVLYHGREHGRLDLTNEAAAEWVSGWLRDSGIDVLILDPLVSFYDQPSGGDPNAAYLRWWAHLEHVVLTAQLRGALILHHAGYSEDGSGRARGASAMMDKPDVNMTFRYETGRGRQHTDAPTDTKRWLSAYGRDVDVEEFELDYDRPQRRYRATGGGGRTKQAAEREAQRCREVIVAFARNGERPTKTALYEELGWPMVGEAKTVSESWYSLAKNYQWIKAEKSGTKLLHQPGDNVVVTPVPSTIKKRRAPAETMGPKTAENKFRRTRKYPKQ